VYATTEPADDDAAESGSPKDILKIIKTINIRMITYKQKIKLTTFFFFLFFVGTFNTNSPPEEMWNSSVRSGIPDF